MERAHLTADAIRQALGLSRGNVAQAARTLGVSRQTIYRWMKAHAIEVEKVVKAA